MGGDLLSFRYVRTYDSTLLLSEGYGTRILSHLRARPIARGVMAGGNQLQSRIAARTERCVWQRLIDTRFPLIKGDSLGDLPHSLA